MANPYHLHQHSFKYKNPLLPMLCRATVKDVGIPRLQDNSFSFKDEPSSPKVSCIGHVKRTNKLIGFPTPQRIHATNTTTPKHNNHHHHRHGDNKYTKLKRLFSGKNLITTTTTTTTIRSTTRRDHIITCGSTRRRPKCNNMNCNENHPQVVNIIELDPPLPVVKKAVQQQESGRDEVNLWKRRSGGIALKGLQVQQILVSNNHCLPPTTV